MAGAPHWVLALQLVFALGPMGLGQAAAPRREGESDIQASMAAFWVKLKSGPSGDIDPDKGKGTDI